MSCRLRSAFAAVLLGLATSLSAQTASQQASTTTLQAGVQLVVLDVVVTDKQGAPVHGLTRDDFHVSENKAEQPLKSLEEHSGFAGESVRALLQPAGTFSNVTAAATGGAVDVLLIDALNTPAQSQPYLRDQLVKYLSRQQPGARVAVFAMTTQLRLLQDFTDDPSLLRRAIKAQGVRFSPLLDHELNDSAAHQESEQYSDMIASATNASQAELLQRIQSQLLDLEAQRASAEAQVRARESMDMLRQIGRYLAGISGRKNLLWFSGSFPVTIQRDVQTTGDPFAGFADLHAEFQRTIDLLARSQVAVYPIDARGLETPPSASPSEDGFTGDVQRTRNTYGSRSFNPRDTQFSLDQAQEHNTMRELAEGTGGAAFYNTNGLAEATAKAIHDGSDYYTVSYTPPQPDTPGYRAIAVRLTNPKGLQLAYRRGYTVGTKGTATAAAGKPVADTAVSESVAQRSAPAATEIELHMQPQVAASANAAKAAGTKTFAGASGSATYQLNLAITPAGISFTTSPDGKVHASVEFAVLLYDSKGKLTDSHQDRADIALDEARFHQIQGSALRYHNFVTLPPSGDVAVRVLVHDLPSGRVGSLLVSAEAIRKAAAPAQE